MASDVTPLLLQNKVRNLKTSYLGAYKWSTETGQGVKADQGEATFTHPYGSNLKLIYHLNLRFFSELISLS